jgi:phosphoglycolate phosphatase-like HAD superfamily hydrolase
MVVRLSQWTLDVRDVEVMGQFWAEALGYRLDRGDDGAAKLYPPRGKVRHAPTMWLQPSAGPKNDKNPAHPDMNVLGDEDVDTEVQRLIDLGAKHVDVGQTGVEPFVVLADPEGNEFCVLRDSPDRSEAPVPRVGAQVDSVLLDVDGTLVDSNYQHVLAWQRAFRSVGQTVAAWRLHRHIGMGGDQLVPAVTDRDFNDRHGDAVRSAWRDYFDDMIDDVVPLDGATELLKALNEAGARVVLASSGAAEHVEHYVQLLDARQVVVGWTTSDDVDTTKPGPDILQVAWDRAGGSHPLTVGDSTWDCEAARGGGITAMAVRTGGFSA